MNSKNNFWRSYKRNTPKISVECLRESDWILKKIPAVIVEKKKYHLGFFQGVYLKFLQVFLLWFIQEFLQKVLHDYLQGYFQQSPLSSMDIFRYCTQRSSRNAYCNSYMIFSRNLRHFTENPLECILGTTVGIGPGLLLEFF